LADFTILPFLAPGILSDNENSTGVEQVPFWDASVAGTATGALMLCVFFGIPGGAEGLHPVADHAGNRPHGGGFRPSLAHQKM
jgi:hypothetical protein